MAKKKDPLAGLSKLARAKRKLKMAVTGKLPVGEHSPAGRKYLKKKAAEKAKGKKETTRTKRVTSGLERAGLTKQEIARFRGKK